MLRTEKEIDCIPKQILVKLMLKQCQNSGRKKKHSTHCKNTLNPLENLEELDFDDYLKWCHGYRRKPVIATLENLSNGDILSKFIMVLSGASYHQVNEPSYFEILTRNKCMYPELFFASIEKDVHRTKVRSAMESESLRRVLSGYAIRNPNLLYCQGLNVVASSLLISEFSEEESFWLLTCLIQQVLPFDCFINLRPIVCLNSIFNDLVKVIVPEFLQLCQRISLQTSFFFVTWMVTLFGKGFETVTFNHFLSIIVLEKEIGLVKIGLTIIKLIYPILERTDDFGAALKLIQEQQKQIDLYQFTKEYHKLYVNGVLFKILFNQYLNDYPLQEHKSSTRTFNLKRRTLHPCSTEYQICLHVVEIERELKGLKENQVLKIKAPLQDLIDDNYIDSCQVKRRKSKSFLKAEFLEQIKIGRHTHICTQEIRSRIKNSTFICQQIEQAFQNLNEGESRLRDMSPPSSSLYEDISGQFEIMEMGVSEEFQLTDLNDKSQEMKEQQAIITSLVRNSTSIKISQPNSKSFLKSFIGNLFQNNKDKM